METSTPKPLGRTQKIAIGALVVPFVVASAAMFLGRATFDAWASFVNMAWITVLIPLMGVGMAGKVLGPKGTPDA